MLLRGEAVVGYAPKNSGLYPDSSPRFGPRSKRHLQGGPPMKIRFNKMLPAILVTGVLVSCAPPYHEKEERYVFVAFNTSLPYWQEAAAGLEDSAKQLGVKAELTGPTNFSTNEEVTAFQEAVRQNPAGILLSASNPEAFRDGINARS